jgi:site-specific recombinase XerD
MEARMSILFYGKKNKVTNEHQLPIYLRVTVEGQRFEVSTHRYVEPGKWSQAGGKAKGNTEEARTINAYLDSLKQKVYTYQQEITLEGKAFTKDTLRIKWFGIEDRTYTLLEIFKQHNDQIKALIGKDFEKPTYTKFNTTLDHTTEFIKWKYNASDINISMLSYSFLSEFEFWLKTRKNCNHNTTIKYLSNLRKIVNFCIRNGWLKKDPFFGFKMSKEEVIRECVTEQELQVISSKDFKNERLNQVRDIFLFSCYTGLAYIDAKRVKRSELKIGIDGGTWIRAKRKKTNAEISIPLLPPVVKIIDAYSKHPKCEKDDCLLPVPSNQKLNSYLKEIADLCGIQKKLTFHIARHTFATTILLNNGVPMETVSKLLSHKSIKVTQIYGKIVDRKISQDMQQLKAQLSSYSS